MAYVEYEYYKSLYGDKAISETDFERLSWEACKKVDNETSGVDGVKKLKIAFPTNEDDAETVKRCICKLIDVMNEIDMAKQRMRDSQGYVQREDGTVVNKLVASVSAGNESISYVTGSSGNATLVDKALTDSAIEKQLYADTITEYLRDTVDANGVNLLYMGVYPCITK